MMKKILRTALSLMLMLCIACASMVVAVPEARADGYSAATVRQAQQYLNRLGYTVKDVNGQLDKATRRQLRAFQRDANLPQTGEPDGGTMYRLERRATAAVNNNRNGYAVLEFGGDYRLLERGSRGKRVRVLNQMLAFLGYEADNGSTFGARTLAGVCAFQRDFVSEHPVDGKAGPYTLSRLEVAYGVVAEGSYTVDSLHRYVKKHHRMPGYRTGH